jgi:hypothetical protein
VHQKLRKRRQSSEAEGRENLACHPKPDPDIKKSVMSFSTGSSLSGPQTPHGAAVARCEGLARTQEGPDSDIEIDQEKKAAILGAMKNIQLNYIPPWALRITENDFEKEVKAAVRNKATPKN